MHIATGITTICFFCLANGLHDARLHLGGLLESHHQDPRRSNEIGVGQTPTSKAYAMLEDAPSRIESVAGLFGWPSWYFQSVYIRSLLSRSSFRTSRGWNVNIVVNFQQHSHNSSFHILCTVRALRNWAIDGRHLVCCWNNITKESFITIRISKCCFNLLSKIYKYS